MEFQEQWELARQRAERRAPEPKQKPIFAGILGLVTTDVVTGLFITIAGLPEAQLGRSVAITSVIGFAAPAAYYYYLERRHHRAHVDEMQKILGEADANRT